MSLGTQSTCVDTHDASQLIAHLRRNQGLSTLRGTSAQFRCVLVPMLGWWTRCAWTRFRWVELCKRRFAATQGSLCDHAAVSRHKERSDARKDAIFAEDAAANAACSRDLFRRKPHPQDQPAQH